MKMRRVLGFAALLMGSGLAAAQVVTVPTTPVVGSKNPATAEPTVTRPAGTPCTVTLFSNEEFNDYSGRPLTYTPPACKGPWAKVVLTMDFTVTAGRQFDRTASVYIGNSNIYFGTTAEPGAAVSPSWHVERDVTDLSAVFKTAQTGQAIVYNIVDGTYTGIIYGTAKLLFYPASFFSPAPIVPDVVIPVSGVNSPYELDTTASQVTASFKAPKNTAKAYLDVISQSQQGDEFWYFCVPSDVAGELESCGNTAFRETEVTIDGKPAGVAPVYPWIYTGGIDPYLWRPITGVQTLNFKPYRVDLTPFAGVLSDGASHTVGISVYNANGYFEETANLLLYTDKLLQTTGGGLMEDTLSAAPTPTVGEYLKTSSTGETTGTVDVASTRNFTVKGYVNTALGRVETTVQQTVAFDSKQLFDITAVEEVQNAVQTSTVTSKTTQQLGPIATTTAKSISFPLTLDYTYFVNPDGSAYQAVTSDQQDVESETQTINGFPIYTSSVDEEVKSADTLIFNTDGSYGPSKTTSSASYASKDSLGHCFNRSIASANNVLTSVNTTCNK